MAIKLTLTLRKISKQQSHFMTWARIKENKNKLNSKLSKEGGEIN